MNAIKNIMESAVMHIARNPAKTRNFNYFTKQTRKQRDVFRTAQLYVFQQLPASTVKLAWSHPCRR